jgi:hypothetical protein
MKKKVRVKSLPKAQNGMQPFTTGNFNVGMPAFNLNTSPSFYADVYQGDPNTTGSFNVGMPEFFQTKKGTPLYFDKPKTSVGEPLYFDKNTTPFNNPFALGDSDFIYNTKRPATSGEFVKSPGMGPIGADDYYANVAQQNIAAPAGTRFDKDFGYAPGTAMPSDLVKKPEQQKGNPYIGPMLLAGTDIFKSVANKLENRNVKQDFRDQFLADNLYNVRPEDYSGNRGDYLTNTPGFGLDFRPDEAIYGDYNKIAQMGGEMKRKVKITNLPQAGYGGTQNAKAVNQLYGNSAYMMNMFNGATKGEPQEEYGQTLGPDPRSISVLEAEKGETLVRKGTNSTIPEFFKIGGKRHSEGGTPLAGDKATPDSFIYSDTKAMKIKDPAILESFGFAAKKGGYTPAKISKKFDLNNKELREGLYSETDPLRKKTAVMMADNYISNLGKLALVQESQKGFPQGVPEIAVPYMDKVGLDPAQFLPEQPMMDPNMQYAQRGAQVKNPEPPRPEALKPYIDKGIITWDAGRGTYRVALTDGQMPAKDRYNLLEELTPVLNKYKYENIVQSGPAKTKSPYNQFYAGFTPQDYEYKIVERNLGKEQADSLDEIGLRKAAYDIMGFKPNVDINNPNIYNDPKFFGEFSRAFYRYLPDKQFRAELGDDEKFGFEHYDAIPKKPKKPPGTPREIPPGELIPPPPTPRRPIGFYPQDVLNAATAVGDLASINRYFPRMAQFTAEPMKPTYYDPNRELAANAEMANIAAANLAQFTGPQAFNTRFSDVQGKGLANAANILGRYNNLNVGVANQFEQANKQLINEANFRNQLAANDFYDKTVATNQNYDNARRAGRRQAVDYVNAALENRFMTEQMNSLYPNYYVEPSRLKTYYTPGRQITPTQRGNDMMAYLESTGIPFDFTDPAVQAALLKGIMGDVNVDERGNIAAAQAGMGKRRSKTS